MKNIKRQSKNILKLALGLMLISGSMMAQNREAVIKQTKMVNDRSLEGHIKQDVAMICSAYSDDALLLPPGGIAPIRGLDNIKNYYLEGFKAGRSLEITTSNIDFQLIDANHANEVGEYTIRYKAKGESESILIKGEMMIFWEKNKAGNWKIKWDMWH